MKFSAFAAVSAVAVGLALASSARADDYKVYAFDNSSSGGTGVTTITLNVGDNFTVTVDPGDLWNAGALPRWSNADGLTGDLLATGTDDSGQLPGTLIGTNFGTWTQGNLTAPFGSLVGLLGGEYEVLGTSFHGPAWQKGTLQLFYWDSNFGDNTQYITASVSADSVNPTSGTPEPAAWSLMIIGFGAAGAMLRRRRLAAI